MKRHLVAVVLAALLSAAAGACAITADDHPHPITRESTTTTVESTGP